MRNSLQTTAEHTASSPDSDTAATAETMEKGKKKEQNF